MSQLKPLMEKNFIEYASYVIIDRAIPDARDGCKPVQRRILHTLHEMHDGKLHKVANIIGETMKLHPHGEVSIGDALVLLANKEYFIEKQGNFGNISTGHSAAAPRYIECRLTPLALETLFNKPLTTFIPSYDGRKREPLQLPAKVPVLLMLGIEGIAVGLATRILPHNFIELLESEIRVLKKQSISLFPDFLQRGLIDVSEYDDGRGKVRVRARIERVNDKRLIIHEIPYSTTTSSLIASIEAAVQKGQVGVTTINDFTTDAVEIELITSRGVNTKEVIPQLYAYTDCEIAISSNIVAIKNNRPIETGVTEYIRSFTFLLKKQIEDELTYELENLEDKQHWLTLEQIFIENRIYKRIEKAKTEKQVRKQVYEGMSGFSHLFIRELTDDDVRRLLDLRIRRISAYDINRYREQIEEVVAASAKCRSKLRSLTKTTISYLKGLIEKYADTYSRRTEIKHFETVDRKSVAKANIRLGYDRATGFFGSSVREQDRQLTVSGYDRILAVSSDGTYRVIAPPEKVLLPKRLIYCARFDPQKGVQFTLIYRDSNKVAWAKKVRIDKFITDKVYNLCNSSPSGIDYLNATGKPHTVRLHFVPKPRQKIRDVEIDLKLINPCGLAARGTRLYAKPVRRIELLTADSNRSNLKD